MEARGFTDQHGVEISTRWWLVDDAVGLVVLAHGASEHSGRYDRFADALNHARFSVVALDHRGHGLTALSTGTGVTGAGGGEALIDDLHELRGAAQAMAAGVPVFFFGHSMGALIGLRYLVEHSDGLAGAVLCGFAADPTDVGALGRLIGEIAEQAGRDQPAIGLLAQNNAGFEPARTPYDWLSRDPAEVDKYIDDPLCGDDSPLTFGLLLDLFGLVEPASGKLDAIDCPVFVIAGTEDPAAGMGENATRLADLMTAAGVPVDVKLYRGARHELLNETNRDDVTRDIVGWIAGKLS